MTIGIILLAFLAYFGVELNDAIERKVQQNKEHKPYKGKRAA